MKKEETNGHISCCDNIRLRERKKTERTEEIWRDRIKEKNKEYEERK